MKKRVIASVLVASTLMVGALVLVNNNSKMVSNAAFDDGTQKKMTTVSTLDAALAENKTEETYIVELVESKLNKDLKLSDWEICLEYLEDNYDALVADESVKIQMVDSYIEGYTFVREEKLAEEETGAPEETGVNQAIANNSYNPTKALEYIETYWDEYNDTYPCYKGWGGDCANFVSQCLYAGGMEMVGSNAASFSNWFCRTSVTENFSKVSSTWRGAEAFAAYWTKNCLEYQDFDISYFEDRLTFRPVFRFANPGDAMTFFNSNGRPYHTTIVNLKNRDGDREIRFAAHSSFQWEKSLFDYMHGSSLTKVRVYRMATPDPALEESYDYDMENVEVEVVDSLNPPAEEKGLWDRVFRR